MCEPSAHAWKREMAGSCSPATSIRDHLQAHEEHCSGLRVVKHGCFNGMLAMALLLSRAGSWAHGVNAGPISLHNNVGECMHSERTSIRFAAKEGTAD